MFGNKIAEADSNCVLFELKITTKPKVHYIQITSRATKKEDRKET